MALRRYDSHTPVVVLWEDAFAKATEQFESPGSALASYKPMLRKSHGIYIGVASRDGREALIIATDDDRDSESPDALGGPIYIPLAMVVSIERLQKATAARRRR